MWKAEASLCEILRLNYVIHSGGIAEQYSLIFSDIRERGKIESFDGLDFPSTKRRKDRAGSHGRACLMLRISGIDPRIISPRLYRHYSLSLQGITKGGNSASALPVPFGKCWKV